MLLHTVNGRLTEVKRSEFQFESMREKMKLLLTTSLLVILLLSVTNEPTDSLRHLIVPSTQQSPTESVASQPGVERHTTASLQQVGAWLS